MANPFNQPPSRPTLGGQKGPTPWMKAGIVAALVLAVGVLAVVVIHMANKPQNTADNSDENLPIPAAPSNSVPELPPEVTAGAANPTNLPDDITPATATAVSATAAPLTVSANGSTVASEPAASMVTAPIAAAPVAAVPLAPANTAVKHHVAATHYRAATIVVRRGDTLWHIARTHHTTVSALKAVNGLHGDRILAGQKLRLPHGGLARSGTHHRTYHHHGGVASSISHRLRASYRRRRWPRNLSRPLP